ncbi:MAG: tetratricopeptide repeat protein [Verrucomicrobia bacterium]|nr:tetratricopeptide repeat protein [Verrucomicrobiota bacterium]
MFLLSFTFCLLLLVACSSAPPPPVVPVTVARASYAAETARKLSANENWSAAVREWQNTVDRYRLLNDCANEAIALHNLAQAHRALGNLDRAHALLEQAADLNQQLGRADEGWRNQITLLQVESQAKQAAALEARFARLAASPPPDSQPQLQGLFFNEFGQWQQRQGNLAKADETLRRAEQAMMKAGDRLGLAVVLANRARLDEAQRKLADALEKWSRARAMFESLADPPGIAASLAGEGRVLLAAGQNLPAAETLLRRASENFHTLKMNDDRADALRLLVECLTVQKKTAEAAEVRKVLDALRTSGAPTRK